MTATRPNARGATSYAAGGHLSSPASRPRSSSPGPASGGPGGPVGRARLPRARPQRLPPGRCPGPAARQRLRRLRPARSGAVPAPARRPCRGAVRSPGPHPPRPGSRRRSPPVRTTACSRPWSTRTRSTPCTRSPARWAACSPTWSGTCVAACAVPGTGPVLLVPVPSRRAVVRRRGHDPLLRISRRAAVRLRRTGTRGPGPVGCWCPAGRVRDQALLDAAARAANLAGSMAARPAAGRGPPGARSWSWTTCSRRGRPRGRRSGPWRRSGCTSTASP